MLINSDQYVYVVCQLHNDKNFARGFECGPLQGQGQHFPQYRLAKASKYFFSFSFRRTAQFDSERVLNLPKNVEWKNIQVQVHTQEQGQTFFMTQAKEDNIDRFRYVRIHPKIIDLGTRLQGITTEFVGFIPWSIILRSIVSGWILMCWSLHIECYMSFDETSKTLLEIQSFFLCNTGSVSWKTVCASGQIIIFMDSVSFV